MRGLAAFSVAFEARLAAVFISNTKFQKRKASTEKWMHSHALFTKLSAQLQQQKPAQGVQLMIIVSNLFILICYPLYVLLCSTNSDFYQKLCLQLNDKLGAALTRAQATELCVGH